MIRKIKMRAIKFMDRQADKRPLTILGLLVAAGFVAGLFVRGWFV